MTSRPTVPERREPPPFRRVEVTATTYRSPDLLRVTLTGTELAGFDPGLPAASCRLLLPEPDGTVELPTWNGNEFLRSDGRRARIRTLTPMRFDPDALELDVEVVLHDESPLTQWARSAGAGTTAAVSGTGSGYEIEADAPAFVVAGDESALPAITTLLPALPPTADVSVIVEVRRPTGVLDLPEHPRATVRWVELADGDPPGTALVAAVTATPLAHGARVWAAGEAAAMQRIRTHLAAAGIPRPATHVRGYWKAGRDGT